LHEEPELCRRVLERYVVPLTASILRDDVMRAKLVGSLTGLSALADWAPESAKRLWLAISHEAVQLQHGYARESRRWTPWTGVPLVSPWLHHQELVRKTCEALVGPVTMKMLRTPVSVFRRMRLGIHGLFEEQARRVLLTQLHEREIKRFVGRADAILAALPALPTARNRLR
jgi:hypothetical protein